MHGMASGRKLWARVGDGVLAVALGGAALGLYLRTLAPSVATLFDDSLEFQLVCYLPGVAHPTGYPLYTLLGKAFTLLPWGDVAFRVNLLSALMGALAVALTFLLARRLTRRRLPALVGAGALAVSPVFWSQSTIAEVYALHLALVQGLFLLALVWAEQNPLRPARVYPAPPEPSMLFAPRLGIRMRRQRPMPAMIFVPAVPDSALARGRETALRMLQGLSGWLRPRLARLAQRIRHRYRRVFPPLLPETRLSPSPLGYVLAALVGLSLTHHRTTILLGPALLAFVLLVEPRFLTRAAWLGSHHPGWRPAVRAVTRPAVLLPAACVLPLFLYLYIPLWGARSGSLDGTYTNTWTGFWQQVMASGYSVFLGENPLARDLPPEFYPLLFRDQFGPVGLALGAVGLVGLIRRPKALALLGLAFAAVVGFGVAYRAYDVEVFFIPAFGLWAVGIGAGLDWAVDLLRPRGPWMGLRRLMAICLWALTLAAIAQPVALAIQQFPDQDRSQSWAVHDYGRDVLAQPLPEGATAVGLLGEMTLLRYFQHAENLRPDLATVVADDEAERLDAARDILGLGQRVYLTRPLPGAPEAFHLSALGPVVEARWNARRDVSPPRKVQAVLTPEIKLLGYDLTPRQEHWQSKVRLDLWWWTEARVPDDLKVSARLLSRDGRLVAQLDAWPVHNTYPTPAWRAMEAIPDSYDLTLLPGTPPGEYWPMVILYRAADGSEVARAELPAEYLEGAASRPPRRALEETIGTLSGARVGALELVGVTPPDPEAVYHPGDAVPLALLWQARTSLAGDLRLSLNLGDGGPVIDWPLPATALPAGRLVRDWPRVLLPASLPDGAYPLRMQVWREEHPLAWERGVGWLSIPTRQAMDLGTIRVEGRSHQMEPLPVPRLAEASFGDVARLLGFGLEPAVGRPGQTLRVTLVWQALAETSTSYTVFIHLLNREGQTVVQHDSLPGGGAFPTTGWLPGEYLVDHHTLDLPDDLPEAVYTLAVGLYDPVTGDRLPPGRWEAGTLWVVR